MKKGKVAIVLLVLSLFFVKNIFALDTLLLDARNQFVKESESLKLLLGDSRDIILVNSMWDSCLVAIAQLDAYFNMIGLFNMISKENLNEQAIRYLVQWLNEIKETNDVNIKSLNSFTQVIEPKTEAYKKRLQTLFSSLNAQIEKELQKIELLKKSLVVF